MPLPADDDAGTEQERRVMDGDQRLAEGDERVVGHAGRVLAQRHDRQDADDADRDEPALDEAGGDVADRELLVVAPEERERQDGGADVGDDQQDLQGRPDEDACVAAAGPEDEVGGVEERVVQQHRRDAGDERDDPQHAGDGRELAD
jgi:hypothetical protein